MLDGPRAQGTSGNVQHGFRAAHVAWHQHIYSNAHRYHLSTGNQRTLFQTTLTAWLTGWATRDIHIVRGMRLCTTLEATFVRRRLFALSHMKPPFHLIPGLGDWNSTNLRIKNRERRLAHGSVPSVVEIS
jgi:hypothetical protein